MDWLDDSQKLITLDFCQSVAKVSREKEKNPKKNKGGRFGWDEGPDRHGFHARLQVAHGEVAWFSEACRVHGVLLNFERLAAFRRLAFKQCDLCLAIAGVGDATANGSTDGWYVPLLIDTQTGQVKEISCKQSRKDGSCDDCAMC